MTYKGEEIQFESHAILNEVKNLIAFNATFGEGVELRSS